MGQIKLNLSALQKNNNDLESKKEITNIDKTLMQEEKGEKLKKVNNDFEKNKNDIKLNDVKIKESNKNNITISSEKKSNDIDINLEKCKLNFSKNKDKKVEKLDTNKINISTINKEIKENIIKNDEKKIIEKEKANFSKNDIIEDNYIDKKNNDSIFFSSYESEFLKKKTTFMEKIRKAKNYVKPKTRLGFIMLLFGLTFFGIAMLFIFEPQVHNFNNYKANILKIKCKYIDKNCFTNLVTSNLDSKIIINDKKNQKDIKTSSNNVNIKDNNQKNTNDSGKINKTKKNQKLEEKIVEKYGEKVTYFVKNKGKQEIIIYDNKEFTKDEFNKKLKYIFAKKRQEKLKQFFQKQNNNK